MATTTSWPASLKAPSREGNSYGYEPDSASQSVEFDYGDRSWQIYSAPWATVSVAYSLGKSQLSVFEAWWMLDLALGNNWFSVSLDLGFGVRTYEAKFRQRPRPIKTGPVKWTFSADLRVRDWQISAIEAEAILAADGEDEFIAIAEALRIEMNINIPAYLDNGI